MRRTLRFALGIGLATALAALAQESGTQKRPLFVSPDGRFGIRIEKTEDADGITMRRVDLVDAKSGAKLRELDTVGDQYASGIRLLWSPDSRRFALVTPSRRGDWTNVWALMGENFEQVNLPEMPSLDMKRDHFAKTVWAPYSGVRWTRPDVLLMDIAAEDDEGNSAKMRVALHFEEDKRVTVKRVGRKDR